MNADKNYLNISETLQAFKFTFLHGLSMYMRCMR